MGGTPERLIAEKFPKKMGQKELKLGSLSEKKQDYVGKIPNKIAEVLWESCWEFSPHNPVFFLTTTLNLVTS